MYLKSKSIAEKNQSSHCRPSVTITEIYVNTQSKSTVIKVRGNESYSSTTKYGKKCAKDGHIKRIKKNYSIVL